MNYSRQRELIRRTVSEYDGHLTANEIYQEVRKSMPNISLGTVYRNLNTMVEHDMLSMLYFDGKEYFEGFKPRHSHVVCNSCGKLCDVELPLFGWLDDMIRQQTGIEVSDRELLARGICKDCMNKK
jgi:Fur family peroxide stress response transcriptional regulator